MWGAGGHAHAQKCLAVRECLGALTAGSVGDGGGQVVGGTRAVEYEFGSRQIRIWGRVFRFFHCEYSEIRPQIFLYL